MPVSVRKAEESDVAAITDLASRLALSAQETSSPPDSFLITGLTETDYAQFVAIADHFYVCVDSVTEVLVGFLFAYSRQAMDLPTRVETILKHAYYVDNFVLIKQVAVAPEQQREGLGTRLYCHLMERAQNTPLLASIVLTPPNPVSVLFHQRFGFRQLLEVEAEDGHPRVVWHRPIEDRDSVNGYLRLRIADNTASGTLLQFQYLIAARLYCHEDNLNWVKIGSFLTLIFFLGAAFSFFWQKAQFTPNDFLPVWGLFLFGVLVHLFFIVSLLSGLRYMMSHKKSLIDVERRITTVDRTLMQLMTPTKGVSNTVKVLYVFPFLSLAAWCVAALLIFLRLYATG